MIPQCFVWQEWSHQYRSYAICCSQDSAHQIFKISSFFFPQPLTSFMLPNKWSTLYSSSFHSYPCLFIPRSASVCNRLSSFTCLIHNTSLTLSVLCRDSCHIISPAALSWNCQPGLKSLFNSVKSIDYYFSCGDLVSFPGETNLQQASWESLQTVHRATPTARPMLSPME